jgi:hypothetical protein
MSDDRTKLDQWHQMVRLIFPRINVAEKPKEVALTALSELEGMTVDIEVRILLTGFLLRTAGKDEDAKVALISVANGSNFYLSTLAKSVLANYDKQTSEPEELRNERSMKLESLRRQIKCATDLWLSLLETGSKHHAVTALMAYEIMMEHRDVNRDTTYPVQVPVEFAPAVLGSLRLLKESQSHLDSDLANVAITTAHSPNISEANKEEIMQLFKSFDLT